jgi:hypothetical protein
MENRLDEAFKNNEERGDGECREMSMRKIV